MTWHCWDPRTLRRTQHRFPHATGPHDSGHPTAGTQSRVHFHPAEEVPLSTAGDFPLASPDAPPPSRAAIVAQPMPSRVPVGTRLTPPPSHSHRCCVCSPRWEVGSPGHKRAKVQFVASTWEVDVETQVGDHPPPLCAFRSPVPSSWHRGSRQRRGSSS